MRNGYFAEEPIVVIDDPVEEGAFQVVQGNRRVATLMILLDDELRATMRATEK